MVAVRNVEMRESKAELSSMSSKFAQTAWESVAAALIVTDLQGCIQYINLAASQLIRRTMGQVRGLDWRECLTLVDEHARTPVPDVVSACLANRKTVQLGVYSILVDAQGAEVSIEGSVAPFRWLDDDVFGTVIMLAPINSLVRRQSYPIA